MATKAQIAANKKNAQKSTGPKTDAGKAASRLNAIKHGLTAKMAVLPNEDPADFEAELKAWKEDWKPPTAARLGLVEIGVLAIMRVRRSVRVENERLTALGEAAVEAFNIQVEADIEKAIQNLPSNPRGSLAKLDLNHQGISAQIELWKELGAVLESPSRWTNLAKHHEMLINLLGIKRSENDDERSGIAQSSRNLISFNRPKLARPGHDPIDRDVALASAMSLRQLVENRITDLLQEQAGFPTPEQTRNRIRTKSYVDTSKEGQCLVRYETSHSRLLIATVNKLCQLTNSEEDLVGWSEPEVELPNEANSDVNPEYESSSVQSEPAPSEPIPAESSDQNPLDQLVTITLLEKLAWNAQKAMYPDETRKLMPVENR